MQQRRSQRAQRHQPEQDEGGGRHQESIERIGSIDGCKQHGRAGGGQDRRDVGDRQRLDGGDALLAARPFAGGEQRQCEQAAEQGAHAGSEQPGIDRIAHHEEAAERQRQASDPDHPAGAEAFLEARRPRGQGWRHAGGGSRFGACDGVVGNGGDRLGRRSCRDSFRSRSRSLSARRRRSREFRQGWWRRPYG